MTNAGFIATVLIVGLLFACSKTEKEVNAASSNPKPAQDIANSTSQSLDYKLICERLTALAPDKRKDALSVSCVADYQHMLPSCQNVAAVNECYANMKEWSERLACLDSCVRK